MIFLLSLLFACSSADEQVHSDTDSDSDTASCEDSVVDSDAVDSDTCASE